LEGNEIPANEPSTGESAQDDGSIAQSNNECIGLILGKVNITAELPQEILKDVELRLASDLEIERFKQALAGGFNYRTGHAESYFEYDHVQESEGFYTPKRLSRNQWRYYVVKEKGYGDTLQLLDLLSNVSDIPLDCSKLRLVSGGTSNRTAHLANVFSSSHVYKPIIELTEVHVGQLVELFDAYSSIPDKELQGEIFRGLNMLDDLGSLPFYSPFIVIGLFAIFELLLTHQPHEKDNSDSISHQLRTKMNLMSHRFEGAIDYDAYFGSVSQTKVWNGLYKYRSLVAHGSNTDFNKAELKILGNANNANQFLSKVLRLLFRQCLKEPQLVSDLKLC
jgi:hypothetical protein